MVKIFLPKNIYSNEGAFAPTRFIDGNMFVVHEISHKSQKTKPKRKQFVYYGYKYE